eukprot:scaffold544683_cov67-Attheya_sp.AAC.1
MVLLFILTADETVLHLHLPLVGEEATTTATTTKEVVPNCLEVRGSSGKWIHDLSYATEAQYNSTLDEQAGDASRRFKPSSGTVPYLPASTYRWQDTFESCQTALFTRDGICKVLHQLNITRVFFVGDSLSFMMVQSFWKLFGSHDDPGDQGAYGGFERVLDCDCVPLASFSFKVVYTRNDHLTNESIPCADVCMDWWQRYMSSQERTLFVVNTGAHTTGAHVFQRDFDAFVDLMDTNTNTNTIHHHHGNDIIFFRTTVPGHVNCRNHPIPFSNRSQFEAPPSPQFSWNKFELYNEYARQRVRNRNRNRNNSDWFELDVNPMTVLRPDGHRPPNDCLHYMLPGPPDWWNHLMYSNLVDILVQELNVENERNTG